MHYRKSQRRRLACSSLAKEWMMRFWTHSRSPLLFALVGSLLFSFPTLAPAAPLVRAPELDGGVGWIGVDSPIQLKDLRGKIVVFDFWTLC
jgi:hypothetical protein